MVIPTRYKNIEEKPSSWHRWRVIATFLEKTYLYIYIYKKHNERSERTNGEGM